MTQSRPHPVTGPTTRPVTPLVTRVTRVARAERHGAELPGSLAPRDGARDAGRGAGRDAGRGAGRDAGRGAGRGVEPRGDVLPTASSVSTRREGKRLTVVLTGDVDVVLGAELARALDRLGEHLDGPAGRGPGRAAVHLDVGGVRALDAHGLRFVEAVRSACARRGATCTTSPARPVVQRVLDLVRPVVDGQLAAS